MQDVADDGNVQTFDPSEFFADGEHIEQRLGRMAVGAVAGVDDAAFDAGRQKIRSTRGGMPHHDQVGLQRLDVPDRVEQRFAFAQTAGVGAHIDDVRAQPLFRQFEGNAGARAGLDENVDDGFAAEGGDFLDPAAVHFLEFRRSVQNKRDLLGRKVIQAEQILFRPGTFAVHIDAFILGVSTV